MPRTLDSKFHLDNIVDQYGADLDADKNQKCWLI